MKKIFSLVLLAILLSLSACANATMVLNQVIQESGLSITMADLGFVNY